MNSEQFRQWYQAQVSLFSHMPAMPKPLIMGVINVTPDSFSDGGQFMQPDKACKYALKLIAEGADLIDIGGESSKPKADVVSAAQELDRVIPVIEKIRTQTDAVISIDTHKADVMYEAVSAGASMINDITALRGEQSLLTAAKLNVPVCLMHMQGTPQTMQENPYYEQPVIDAINIFFEQRMGACLKVGIPRDNLILDPGFGFGKTVQHNLLLIKHFKSFQRHKLPLLLGVSRKSSLGAIVNQGIAGRLSAGVAMTIFAASQGMNIIRTHDVAETSQAFKVLEAIMLAKDETTHE